MRVIGILHVHGKKRGSVEATCAAEYPKLQGVILQSLNP